jgi:hypothetical protein
MNEHIKELMLEAGYAAPELAERAQKLAQLIVQECASIVTEQSADRPYLAKIIKQNFGVEE